MSIFSKLFGVETTTLESIIEQKFESSVRDAYKNSSLKGSMMEALPIMTAIKESKINLKNQLKENRIKNNLTLDEIEKVVDEVGTKIWNKYIKE